MIIRNKVAILGETKMGKCNYCGKTEDLRPYGKDQAMICYNCGMKPENRKTTDEEINKLMDTIPKTPIN